MNTQHLQASSHYKYFVFIAMLYVLVTITALSTTPRLVEFTVPFTHFSAPLPGGLFIFPFIYFLSDICTEVYGYARSRQIVWFSMFCAFIYLAAIHVTLALPSPSYFQHQHDYNFVFRSMTPVFLGTLSALILGSFVNDYLVSKSKIRFKGRYFWLRAIFATAVGEAVVGIVGGGIAFIGSLGLSRELVAIIAITYIFNLLYEIIAMPLICLAAWLLKISEKTDVYDYGIDYNPFTLSLKNKSKSD